MADNSVRLHRVLRVPAERVYLYLGWQESLAQLAQLAPIVEREISQ